MTKYHTRVRRRRLYSWSGRPFRKDRKVLNLEYQGLVVKSDGTEDVTITPGNFILIEGEDEERPFVAKLKELYDDGKKCRSVTQLKPEDPFPETKKSANVLYVKLLWDGKRFKPIANDNALHNGPASNKTLPKPQFYAFEGDAVESRLITRSATRTQKNEIESRHSASKSSLSKERGGTQRIPNGTGTPGARKKLQLNGSPKSQSRVPNERDLKDDFETLGATGSKRRVAFSGLPDSPPKKMLTDGDLCLESCFGPLQDQRSTKFRFRLTPLKPTPPEEQKSSKSCDKPAEERGGGEPQTPRSRRRSAQVSASLIRKQIKIFLEDDLEELNDDDADFVPLKESKMLSSSDDDEDDDEAESEEKSPKRTIGKRLTPRTPTSSRKASARTPSKTPVSKAAHVATPKIPERKQPVQKPANILEEARIRLHVSAVPESLPCREQEYQDIYSFLLTGQKVTADHAAALLEKRFSTPASNRETTVLLVDELDLLWTRKQNVMYSLFDWPTRKHAKLIVLAIANTMDLPERIMMNRVASRLGLTRMSFQPYTHKQLQQIITSRLNHVKAFEDDAIQLVSRKVAALSGDARRCLDICRRATEICEFSSKKSESSLVKMPHVIEALDEMFSSPYVMAIRSASVQEQAFLKAVIAEFRRSGLEESTFQQVYHQYIALCRIEGVQPPSMSETMAVCLRLGASRLLLVESSRNDLHLRVRINVSQDDIMYALKEE
ncbi:hypothetical protein GDO78_019735 [Eleutherodactylus coqui]|uniref:Origin recognition complex subunit 1 n=1 Tax=Eleutherodactylus coqui TaxID=57060 RepID=A0A8J6EI89_ELECQ|nr:hypothetical protein GDO78_019735 [Eleutherodactylus coqui]